MDEVIVLGAGTSVCAGAPTMAEFRQRSQLVEAQLPHNFGHTAEDVFRKTLNFWSERFPQMNIEEFYVLAEVQQLLAIKNPIPSTSFGLAECVQYLIAKTLERSMPTGQSPHHNRMVDRLKARRDQGEETAIISLNWDLAIDNAFHRKFGSASINYGYQLAFNLESGEQNERGGWPLLKLHGSLNWWHCTACDRLYFQPETKAIIGAWEGVRPECENKHCTGAGKPMTPLMIPPTSQKLVGGSHASILQRIWNEARGALQKATALSIVGYSFPQTDVQLRMFMLDAVLSNPNIESISIVTNRKFGSDRMHFEDHFWNIFQRIPNSVELAFAYDGFEAWSATV